MININKNEDFGRCEDCYRGELVFDRQISTYQFIVTCKQCGKEYELKDVRYELGLEDLKGEYWKDVIGYEGIYKVSNFGRIKSLARIVQRVGRVDKTKTFPFKIKEKILKPILATVGYYTVNLAGKYSEGDVQYVHRIVCSAFHTPQNSDENFVNHLLGFKRDNSVNRIAWTTQQNNNDHAREKGLNTHAVNEEKMKKIIEFYLESDLPVSLIAKKFSIEDYKVTNYIFRHKIKRNTTREDRLYSRAGLIVEDVSALIKSGSTYQEVANKYGCKRSTVQSFVKRNNIKTPFKEVDFDKDFIIQCIDKGMSYKEIAKMYNKSYTWLSGFMSKQGFNIIQYKKEKGIK